MRITVTDRQQCRVCGSSAVRRFLDFADYPLADNHLDSPQSDREFLCRYRAFWCPECKTVQNLTDFDWSAYYSDYDYTVSASGFARTFMDRLAANTIDKYGLATGSSVVEIGSSDGHQLACFQKRGMKVFGYEPGHALAERARDSGIPTVEALFGSRTLDSIPSDMKPVQVFLCSYTFDHVPDPVDCLRAMRSVLEPQRGLVVIEVHDLERIIERREACLFCHEHTVYPSRTTMASMMERAGLRLVSVDLVPEDERRGNSLLAVGVPDASAVAPDLSPPSEMLTALDDWHVYDDFASAVEKSHRNLADHVRSQLEAGRRIAAYGASGRAIATLALAGLTHREIAYVCDANPSLHGLYLPKSHVPVRPPEHVPVDPVDEIIVFAYGYMDEIRASLSGFVERGGRLVSLLELLRDPAVPTALTET